MEEFQVEAVELWTIEALKDPTPSVEKIQTLERILPGPEFAKYFNELGPDEGKIIYALQDGCLADLLGDWLADYVGYELGAWWSDNKAELSHEENKKVIDFIAKAEDKEFKEGFYEALGISKSQLFEVL